MSRTISAEPRRSDRPASRYWLGRRIHLVGIGGSGVSGLARLLRERGAACSGSDNVPSELTASLRAEGIPVTHDQDGSGLPAECDLVVASAAIRPEHPELAAAAKRGLPILSYAEALGRVEQEHTGASIAGTHGKSTTAAMLCHALVECGLDPSLIVGASCPQIGGGSRTGAAVVPGSGPLAGRPGILVAEACEFNRSFHHHRPVMGLINNIEEDHLDIYHSLAAIIDAFEKFAALLPPAELGGRLLIAHEGAHREQVTRGARCAVETFGFGGEADYQVTFDSPERRVRLLHDGAALAEWSNLMPGRHNALNSAAAAVLARHLGAEWSGIAAALGSFRGLDRRMQRLGSRAVQGGRVVVYDDYGHHPTEISSTLGALREAERPKRLVCVFQPHQHSRTRFLLEQFAESFSSADLVIVPDIYFVRDSEIEKQRVSAEALVDRLRRRGVRAMHLYPFEAIVEQLEVLCRGGDLLVIMGAGPVWQVARAFLQQGDAGG